MRYSVVTVGDGFGIHDETRPCHNCIIWSKDENYIVSECHLKNTDTLIRLYTDTAGHYISAHEWAKGKEHVTALTKDGERIHDLQTPYYQRKRAENPFYGFIHRDNLGPTKKEAIEKREAIYKELYPSIYN